MKQLAAQGTIDRSPRPSALHVAWRSNIKVFTPHWAISSLHLQAIEGTLGVFLPIKGLGLVANPEDLQETKLAAM